MCNVAGYLLEQPFEHGYRTPCRDPSDFEACFLRRDMVVEVYTLKGRSGSKTIKRLWYSLRVTGTIVGAT